MRKRIKKLKKLKGAVDMRRSKKNWLYNYDINPDGIWKPRKKKVRSKES